MASFTKIEKTKTIKYKTEHVEIFKFVKDGTNRIFWSVEKNGVRISKTMFARLNECESSCFNYLRKSVA